jgi:hypothetical protein
MAVAIQSMVLVGGQLEAEEEQAEGKREAHSPWSAYQTDPTSTRARTRESGERTGGHLGSKAREAKKCLQPEASREHWPKATYADFWAEQDLDREMQTSSPQARLLQVGAPEERPAVNPKGCRAVRTVVLGRRAKATNPHGLGQQRRNRREFRKRVSFVRSWLADALHAEVALRSGSVMSA